MCENTRTEKKKIIAAAFVLAILCFLFMNRLIRGADTTDEAFYATLAYRLCNGSHLFKDMWEQCSTSAVFPAFLLKLYRLITGGNEGCILFFRIAYFSINILLALLETYILKKYVGRKWAILVAGYFCFHAPMHLYTFSYNTQADFLLLLISLLLLLAAEKKEQRFYFLAGVVSAWLAMCYPPMIILCPIMVIGIWLRRKAVPKGWILFAAGGFSTALIIVMVLLLTVGFQGISNGINGILSDPIYGNVSASLSERFLKAIAHPLKKIFDNEKFLMKAYVILLCFVLYFNKKHPYANLLVIIYPFIVWLQMYPTSSLIAFAAGTFGFYMAIFAPVLFLFLNDGEHKRILKKLFNYIWIPSLLLYTVIEICTSGETEQGEHGLVCGGIVTLVGIIFLIKEVFSDKRIHIIHKNIKLAELITAVILTGTLLLEISVYYSVVYRDLSVKALNTKIESGPYKGIYTSSAHKNYLEKMTDIMQKLENDDESACILYHSNFAYLMLDSKVAAPTTWGVYPHFRSEDVFIKYFAQDTEHIPDAVYIVDVPDEYNFECQQSHYYGYCHQLKAMLADYYSLDMGMVLEGTGRVEKYTLTHSKEELQDALRIKVEEWPIETQNPLYQIPLYQMLRNAAKKLLPSI